MLHLNKKAALVGGMMSLTLLAGCANTSTYSGDVYRAGDVQTAQTYRTGMITAIRSVQIQADSKTGNLLGSVGGAVVGGLLGNQIGGGSGRTLATAAGALGGLAAGSHAEDAMNRVNAWEMEIQMDDGQNMIIVQKADREFMSGQRVRVVGSGQQQRVVPY